MSQKSRVFSESRITVIITGGMIMQEFDEESGCYIPNKNSKEIIQSIGNEINLDKIDIVEFSVIDSSAATMEFLYNLAKCVQRKINNENIDGLAIITGSDTMELIAYFLHRCIYVNSKPIVITGAMRVLSSSDYDGKANITNAIKQVANPESCLYGYGVSINFAGKIHSPVHVMKEHSFAIDPFSSGTYGLIGMMHTNRINWLNNPKKSTVIPLPDNLESVPIVYAFPGATSDYLDGFINKYKGVIVVGYGSGNVSENMFYAIKNVIENGLKVVLVTNCKYGGVFSEYGGTGGNQSLKELGVIMAHDLTPYQAMIVASLLFSNEKISKDISLQNYFSNKILF